MKKSLLFLSVAFLIGIFSFIFTTTIDAQGNGGLPDADTFEVTSDVLNTFDPLQTENSPHAAELSTPGGIISRALSFVFPIAGLALFVMIVAGGLQILAGASNGKSLDAGKQRVTMAILGFILLFASYWIAQILEAIFGLKIL